ncbi:MAG: adenylate/guanylate cyclase domain-containing protein [Pseudomonadota bacterium]
MHINQEAVLVVQTPDFLNFNMQDPPDGTGDIPVSARVEETLDRHKEEGLELAIRARWITLGIVAAFLPFVVPLEQIAWPWALLALVALNGWFLRRVGRRGHSGRELVFIFIDVLLMTIALLAPNPLSTFDWPTAMVYRFDTFLYYFVILAVGCLAYSWRTILALGHWMSTMYLLGSGLIWYFGRQVPAITEAFDASGFDAALIYELDPNIMQWDRRLQEVLVLLLVAYTLAIIVRRFQRLLVTSAETERERSNLSRYFSPNVVSELSGADEPLSRIREHDIAVLFVDIVGFTAYAASRPPTEVIETLRAFQSAMERQVFAHGGTLDKFLGDGLMATFGTPIAGPQDAENAVFCVRAMMAEVDRLNLRRRAEGKPEIDARFGVHYGPAVLGNIGTDRLEFAVIGNTVNVASRMQELSRSLGVPAVISDAAVQAAGIPRGVTEDTEHPVRGASSPVKVWTMV